MIGRSFKHFVCAATVHNRHWQSSFPGGESPGGDAAATARNRPQPVRSRARQAYTVTARACVPTANGAPLRVHAADAPCASRVAPEAAINTDRTPLRTSPTRWRSPGRFHSALPRASTVAGQPNNRTTAAIAPISVRVWAAIAPASRHVSRVSRAARSARASMRQHATRRAAYHFGGLTAGGRPGRPIRARPLHWRACTFPGNIQGRSRRRRAAPGKSGRPQDVRPAAAAVNRTGRRRRSRRRNRTDRPTGS